MSIGLVCHFLENDNKQKLVNILGEKTLQLNQFNNNKYSQEQILSIYQNNVSNLENLINKIIDLGFRSYRMSSGLFPLFDKVDQDLFHHNSILKTLSRIGEKALKNKLRLTFHPDHFVVLSSDKESVVKNSIQDLSYHAWIMDKMNLEQNRYYSINIHASGKGRLNNIIQNINLLPDNIKNRLTLENDELSANVLDLFQVYKNTGVAICLDSHHHTFNSANLNLEEAIEIANSTWENIKPIQHLSNTEPECVNLNFQNRRKHSDFVHYIPDIQLKLLKENSVDIDFEFKMKNLAIFDAIKKFELSL